MSAATSALNEESILAFVVSITFYLGNYPRETKELTDALESRDYWMLIK